MKLLFTISVALLACVIGHTQTAALFSDASAGPVSFAATEIRNAQSAKGGSLVELGLDGLAADRTPRRFVIAVGRTQSQRVASQLGIAPLKSDSPQSYGIRRSTQDGRVTFAVLGADAAGAMYGGLDLAEAVRLGTLDSVADSDHSPRVERRGIKFNVPLDVRTPSYSDNSDAAQSNIGEMWSFDFWRDFLDNMARHRYNVLSLWNLHPFPSIVKVPEYPDVALDDVKRTLIPMDDTYSHSGGDMFRPVLLSRTETLRKMSIADKVAFWRDVMRYAHDRGIEVYWFTWNIFTFGAEGKYGITSAADESENHRLLPGLRPRNGAHVSAARWHRHHRRRTNAGAQGWFRQGDVALEDIWRRYSRCAETPALSAISG